ncbi:unnamed protein product [Oncorhynchus mykiss]|uniref:Condensin-2 complex subunit H2 n=1 Tax=Oncorhynchus mykiss TaxID=8022 RepID=A0A060XDA7_ONCMY|nr:unnamed protein product [Oncorhynchus mykiss]
MNTIACVRGSKVYQHILHVYKFGTPLSFVNQRLQGLGAMDTVETRFTHLLQPIRELTKNWDIDVASELADYLEEPVACTMGQIM